MLTTHIQNIQYVDMTHGHHCGYVSPIPFIKFNDVFSEKDFRVFIEAISNDIIQWKSAKEKITDWGLHMQIWMLSKAKKEVAAAADSPIFVPHSLQNLAPSLTKLPQF